jgi:hypothetical protein
MTMLPQSALDDEHLLDGRKIKVSVVGGGIIVELLKRCNFKEVRVIEKKVEKEQLYLDVFYDKPHVGTIPKYTSLGNTYISTFAVPDSIEEFKKILKGSDVVIGGYGCEDQKKAAIATVEVGLPFISCPAITTILPDGIPFEEIEFPSLRVDATLNTISRCFQIIETMKLFSGVGDPFFPPNALIVEFDTLKLELKMEKIKLKIKVKDAKWRESITPP